MTIFCFQGCGSRTDSRGHDECFYEWTFSVFRAVALGLTAEDMMSVYEYQENLKEQKKVKELETSTAEVIKREVVHQQMDAQVGVTEHWSSKWDRFKLYRSYERIFLNGKDVVICTVLHI